MTTSSPRASRVLAVWNPMNPAAPVTKTRRRAPAAEVDSLTVASTSDTSNGVGAIYLSVRAAKMKSANRMPAIGTMSIDDPGKVLCIIWMRPIGKNMVCDDAVQL
ncbi:hypothetical protein PC121_g23767 [Phytophthora cactorum]|nr:hypothetical protein PC121_g23767 [Phytophthora cactorum]